MSMPLLSALICLGTLPLNLNAQGAPKQPLQIQIPRTSAERIQRLKTLVDEAEKALDADEDDLSEERSDEAEVLIADWPTDLLVKPEVQALLQRLKEVEESLSEEEGMTEPDPGLKVQEEVLSLKAEDLRAESERIRSAERGAIYDFPIDLNDKVLTWVRLFSTERKGYVERSLSRASQFMPMIRQVFAEEGIPQDLAYLGLVESGYVNQAKSRAAAVGMWQFIRATGRIYGLEGNAWLEERRDPIKATRAAARYLKKLYEITGDWYLATASYNAGPLSLERAAQQLGSRNFWDMHRSKWLRVETKNYVPELCAAILVGRNPELYGLKVDQLQPYAFETVAVNSMTSLHVLARCAGTDVDTLRDLNPELLRGMTPPGSYTLRVPPGKALSTAKILATLPNSARVEFRAYVVRRGDTVARLAKRFQVTPQDLLEANDLSPAQFRPGRRIKVPPPPILAVDDRDLTGAEERKTQFGDKPLSPLPAFPGDASLPERATSPASQGEKPVSSGSAQAGYVAEPGDTLAKIARDKKLPFWELVRLNPHAAETLKPGDVVQLPDPAAKAVQSTPILSKAKSKKKIPTKSKRRPRRK
jgi:membrane-bound lytic murein transglycosylase D